MQYDLDDNGKLDSNEFVKMLQSLGTDVSKDEADAAMEVRPAGSGCTAIGVSGARVRFTGLKPY
jgi:Ca2+-binding EF-hand superfamily protein